MKLKGKLLDLLFRRIAPERLLNRLQETCFSPPDDMYRSWFLSVAEETLHGYSGDEKLLLYQLVDPDGAEPPDEFTGPEDFYERGEQWENACRRWETCAKGAPPFWYLADYGEDTLIRRGEDIFCKFSSLLDWRSTYFSLGQDMIVTAWLARVSWNEPESFAWPGVVPTDNRTLSHILSRGIAENHYHLYGSAEVFALNWCRLMNYPRLDEKGKDWFRKAERNLQSHISRGAEHNRWPMRKRALYAAVLRALLFVKLRKNGELNCLDVLREFDRDASKREAMSRCRPEGASYVLTDEEKRRKEEKLQREEEETFYRFLDERTHELMRRYLGPYLSEAVLFEQPEDDAMGMFRHRLDYAFTKKMKNDSSRYNRILCGERAFLFHCFQSCFRGEFDRDTQWLFYLYLLLKSSFREELVQVNRETGFRNFQDYGKRKSALWTLPENLPGDGTTCRRNAYSYEAIRTAVNEPLDGQPISALELRLSPKDDERKLLKLICDTDRVCAFHWRPENDREAKRNLARTLPDSEAMASWYAERDSASQRGEAQPDNAGHFFYVLHFIKEEDNEPESNTEDFHCRHHNLRRKHLKEALAVRSALNKAPWLRQRIRGIDACSNELVCRPEVYAVPFRFLKDNYAIHSYPDSAAPARRHPLSLHATCHVGEDFFDIADGLRAVDEAILFLNLSRGNRLGHALALGVNPERHYRAKHGCVVLPKQNLLDNLTWLYYRGTELDIAISPNLKDTLRNRAEDLLTELYRDIPNGAESLRTVTLRDYYESWLLRGDNPYWYCEIGQVRDPGPESGNLPYYYEFRDFALNNFRERRNALDICRRGNQNAVTLLHYYHFHKVTRRRGMKSAPFRISDEYVRLMAQVQRKMRSYVTDTGLSVECNPTSNTLIGSFRDYGFHPVFLFNASGLYHEDDAVQMHVSINTDDQGVFETNLAQEYSLVAAALCEQRDKTGARKYREREIEEYIRRLQWMSHEQSFSRSGGVKEFL